MRLKKTPNRDPELKGSHPEAQGSTIKFKIMKTVTVDNAIQTIQKRFRGLAEIIHVDGEGIIDILCKDLYSGKYFEVWSNAERTRLSIEQVNL